MKHIPFVLAVVLAWAPAPGAQRMGWFDVTEYGAVGDGRTLNTGAIQKAIAACADSGGGTVVIPAGRFVSGPIELRGGIELRLEAGAVLESSRDIQQYSGGREKRGLIYARDAQDITLSGPGTIEGNGTAFMEDRPKGLEHTTGRYTRQGQEYRGADADGPNVMRPRPGSLVHFKGCKGVVLRDITLKDPPAWTVHIDDCESADIRGVKIYTNLLIPNSDGIHCVTSRNVHISDCDVQAGDDAIAITGLWGRPGAMAENITVSNCTLMSRSSGVRVGYGSNSIRRCAFQNLVIHDSNRGLGVFVRDEGSVTDVLFSNVVIQTRLHAGWWGNGEPVHVSCLAQKQGTRIGRIENVRFSNIQARSEHGIVVWAEDESRIRNLAFSGIDLEIMESPRSEQYGGNFDLRPAGEDRLSVFQHDIPGLYARGVDGLRIADFRLIWSARLPALFTSGIECEQFSDLAIDGFAGGPAPKSPGSAAIALSQGREVTVRNCRALPGTGTFLGCSGIADARLLMGNDLKAARTMVKPGPSGFTRIGNLLPDPQTGARAASTPE